jgi:two-component system response regulator HydG
MECKLLVVDDDEPTCEFLEATLSSQGFRVTWDVRAESALQRLREQDFDVTLTDLGMEGINGIEFCQRAIEIQPDMPVIVVTGQASLDAAIAAIRVGAYDFITKPVDTKLLGHQVRRAIEHRRLGREIKRLRQELADAHGLDGIIGRSAAMRRVFNLVQRLRDSDASVLVTGESGTGKELVARSIHENSERKNGPFIALNCAAVPPTLLESELFGHTKGAFTDAKRSREGLFVQADSGTLFLDEVGELPLEMQPKLLRALQERRVRPVGGDSEVTFDARIVTATNRDLESDVEAGRFREDLLYRIDVVRIELPPLRARGRDVLLLAQHFLQRHTSSGNAKVVGISEPAAEKLLSYDWPGNVRELENCVERAVALARFDQITVEDLPRKVREHHADRVLISTEDPSELLTLEQLEQRYIAKVLTLMGGNKSQAAKVLGLDRRTLYRRLDKFAKS